MVVVVVVAAVAVVVVFAMMMIPARVRDRYFATIRMASKL